MNRFVIGGILAAIVLLLTGSLNRLFADRAADRAPEPRLTSTQRDNADVSDLGTLPVEQAGQLVRRQSDLTGGGVSAASDSVFNDVQGMPPGGRATISPNTTGAAGSATPGSPNVIPRTAGAGAATTFPAATGDVAPIRPDLVQPGVTQPRPETDADLDSIPALW